MEASVAPWRIGHFVKGPGGRYELSKFRNYVYEPGVHSLKGHGLPFLSIPSTCLSRPLPRLAGRSG